MAVPGRTPESGAQAWPSHMPLRQTLQGKSINTPHSDPSVTQPPAALRSRGKAPLHAIAAARELVLFLLFATLYCLPLMLDNASSLQLADPRIRKLLGDVLAMPVVRMEIARNIGGHFMLLVASFWILSSLAKQLSAATSIEVWKVRLPVLLAGWMLLIAGNALLFPQSNYSIAFSSLARPGLAYGLGTLFSIGCLYALLRTLNTRRRLVLTGAAGALLVVSGFGALQAVGSAPPAQRNIIIVGVDSLSASAFGRLRPSLPNLSHLMDTGVNHQRAYTPLGRTFPAWVSILSGKPPAEHGAIFNLRDMDHVAKRGLISGELRSRGYRTVYAIDERRFNNLDQSFGFDYVIGPRAGALDFIVQRLNDTPLSNLLMQSGLGKQVMPFSYINAASPNNYDAEGFVGAVLNKVAGARQLFLAVHFESAHFPFATRHAQETFTTPNQFWNKHAAALTAVDRQVGLLMAGLAQQGYLDSALVIVLSDHGEGLGEVEADITLGGEPTQLRVYGHGADVLSDHENHIVLGIIDYRNGRPSGASTDTRQVSLLDLKPLMSRYASHGDAAIHPGSPCIFVESGLRFSAAADYRTLNEADLAADAADYYEIDTAGRMRLREDQLRHLVDTKDIGLRCKDHITYLSSQRQRFFTLSLDEHGLPGEELPPDSKDITEIHSYRARLLASLGRPAPSELAMQARTAEPGASKL
jgi:hypothetical protein